MANFTISVDSYENLPASSVGDGAATTEHGEVLSYTRAMFTTNTVPPYADPEGDAALNLKVTSLPVNGLLKLNSVDVTLNQIISFADIDSGLFTYTPDTGITAAYDASFSFQIADAGSGIFVG